MLKIQFENIEELKTLHYNAVEDYVQHLSDTVQDSIYASIIQLNGFSAFGKMRDKGDYSWLRLFILADLETMRTWVASQADKLKFTVFQDLYGSKFSNGTGNYVDATGTYNAYVLIDKMDLRVCPYCDDEYLDVVEANGKTRRTSEFDHYFPEGKNKYPALAMCFFNLVLSGQNCNGIKLQNELGSSPYDDGIEEETFLYPDLEIGVNMENVKPEDCKVLLNAKQGMLINEKVLGLADRYANRYIEAYHLLKRKQQFSDNKLDDYIKMGMASSKDEVLAAMFGPPYESGKFKVIHQKLKHDLIGF